jgi:hypothetical protein
MASTFSNLGLILQATGENSGTWGERTNVNLQRLDNAVSGYSAVAVAATSTSLTFSTNTDTTTYTDLPTADGTSGQAITTNGSGALSFSMMQELE